jgi:hypothetical protein
MHSPSTHIWFGWSQSPQAGPVVPVLESVVTGSVVAGSVVTGSVVTGSVVVTTSVALPVDSSPVVGRVVGPAVVGSSVPPDSVVLALTAVVPSPVPSVVVVPPPPQAPAHAAQTVIVPNFVLRIPVPSLRRGAPRGDCTRPPRRPAAISAGPRTRARAPCGLGVCDGPTSGPSRTSHARSLAAPGCTIGGPVARRGRGRGGDRRRARAVDVRARTRGSSRGRLDEPGARG